MAKAWLEVFLDDKERERGHRTILPVECAERTGSWLEWLKGLNLRSSVYDFIDDDDDLEEMVVEDVSRPGFNGVAGRTMRLVTRSTSHRHEEYPPDPMPSVLSGVLHNGEGELPLDWEPPQTWEDIHPYARAELLRKEGHSRYGVNSSFVGGEAPQFNDEPDPVEEEDDLMSDVDRAMEAEARNDQGVSYQQRLANALLTRHVVVTDIGHEHHGLVGVASGWDASDQDSLRVDSISGIHVIPLYSLEIATEAQVREYRRREKEWISGEPVPAIREGKQVPGELYDYGLPDEELVDDLEDAAVKEDPDVVADGDGLVHGNGTHEPYDRTEGIKAPAALTDISVAYTKEDWDAAAEQARKDGVEPVPHWSDRPPPEYHDDVAEGAPAPPAVYDPPEVSVAEVAEQAAKGAEKLKAEAKELAKWKRQELPWLLEQIDRGYSLGARIFRDLNDDQLDIIVAKRPDVASDRWIVVRHRKKMADV